jgi:hypothetical protein
MHSRSLLQNLWIAKFVALSENCTIGAIFGLVRASAHRIRPLLQSCNTAITITFGATVFSDTLSLIVFAICVPIYQSGFSVSGLVVQLIEIAIFVPHPIWAESLGSVHPEKGGR